MAENKQELAYWTKQLQGSRPAELFCDKPRPAMLSGEAGEEKVIVEGELYKSLQRFCRLYQVTPFIVLLSAFRATHFRLTGAEDATIGYPIANRNRQELEGLIGFFVNLQCIRITVQGETFESLVRQVQSTAATAFENQDVPFEKIVTELKLADRDASRNPLVQITFAVHNQLDYGRLTLEGLQVEPMPHATRTRFDLEFHLYQQEASFQGSVLFAKELFLPETIKNLVSVFNETLRQGLNQPQVPVPLLPLTGCLSYQQSADIPYANGRDYPRESSVVDVFRQQVTASPNTIAVKDGSSQLTYTELDHQSEQLSRWLAKKKLKAETLVGVLAARSCQAIVAFLGILKANLAYLPLDINAPPGRIQMILSSVRGPKLVLLGEDTLQSQIKIEAVETVSLREILSSVCQDIESEINQPSARSLAYVMFTSGSTGQPKGVMIEHRGIVRLAKQTYMTPNLNIGTGIAHIANLAFDASTWEIYTAILNGATLVCLDYMTVLDIAKLSSIFMRENIRIAKFTPALLEQCLLESPDIFRSLHMLFSAGDRLHPHIARLALKSTSGHVLNAYGPTENTGFSTCFDIPRAEPLANTVPIGQAIDNSGAVVMDSRQCLVPIGVIGELVVTGDGLARGYLDPAHNRSRFIEIVIDGQSIKAYRTGDYVRRRPADGVLEYIGRIDHQVKIRGHRVELGEIEQVLLSNDLVRDAVALLQSNETADPKLVAFVTLRDQAFQARLIQHSSNDEVEEVNAWAQLRKDVIYAEVDSIEVNQLGRDFMGWKSMYDGHEISKHDMAEWLQDTLCVLFNGQEPSHVLEIGTGTGMILFNLREGLESYLGLEPVVTVADFVRKMAESIPRLADKVNIQVGTATDISSLKGVASPTTVIVNSVAQYFPSPEYLRKVVTDLLQLRTVDYIFFGDIRSYALYEQFLVTMAKHHFGTCPSIDELREFIEEMKQSEKELLIDPAFFTALKVEYPHLVEHVEILPKRMEASNELSCYRYAAVVHTKLRTGKAQEIHVLNKDEWHDFEKNDMDSVSLLELLRQKSSSTIVGISNIPHSKTYPERSTLRAFREGVELIGEWAALLDRTSTSRRCLSANDLTRIAEKAGFQVEISWARQFSQHGGLDAVFHRLSAGPDRSRVLFKFPTDHEGRPLDTFTNRPLQFRQNRKVEKMLHSYIQTKLPSYMSPTVIKIIDKMPINQNKKIDRLALAKITNIPNASEKSYRIAPRNDIEHALCEEFAAILETDVGITDSFFYLGGHSLMATRAVSRINNRLDCKISVFDFYQFPTPAALYELIVLGAKDSIKNTSPGYLHCHSRLGSKATIVLIHGFWGQGNIFMPLVPLLNDHFDVILVHDPFFGKLESPETITEWARFYLDDISKSIDQSLPVILGGYSLGGLIAFEMASIWRNQVGSDPASILLLDAGSYPSLAEFFSQESMPEETISRGLTIFGHDQRALICQHFEKLRSLSIQQLEKHIYNGDCLYLPTPEAFKRPTAQWWRDHCPKIQIHSLDCGHDDVLGQSMVQTVAQLINKHYDLLRDNGGRRSSRFIDHFK